MDAQKINFNFFTRHKLPIQLQTENAECGLACLTMIANFYGHRISLFYLRQQFLLSSKGSTLKDIINIANELQLHSRPVRLDLHQLKQLKCPCILHWDMCHFVVLKQVKRQHIIIHDPAIGKCKVSMQNVSNHFTGIALELSPYSSFQPTKKETQVSFFSLMGNVQGLKRGLLQIFLLGIALQICALITPFYLQWIIDEAIVVRDFNLITVLGLGFLMLVLMQTAIEILRSWITTVLSTDLNFQWLGNVFSHILKLPLEWFHKRHLGDIISRFNSIQSIQEGLTTKVVEGIIDGFLVIATFIMMIIYSAKLSLLALIAIVLYAGLRWLFFHKQRYITAEKIIHQAKQESHFLESIRGMQSVRLFNHQKERHIGWVNTLVKQFNADLQLEKLTISFQGANTLLFGIERVLIIWLAALLVLNQQFSIGMLFAFMSYKTQLTDRVVSLIDKICDLLMLRLHAERLSDIVLSKIETDLSSSCQINMATLDTTIELRNVSFRYAHNEPYVIQNINLVIPTGQAIAITGPSGCGKTTLLKLLLGLINPTEGEVLIGRIPLKQIGFINFRQIVGSVMQDDHLFSGSIRDNICFFSTTPDQKKIEKSAKYAAIHDEIMSMPMQYNTLIGDIGTGLSGGQKQRILLARALYRQPRVLALDEATSHLDVNNEHTVNQSIKKLKLTRIIIAHRQETISTAERIIQLNKGAITFDSIQYNEKMEKPTYQEHGAEHFY